MEGLGVILLTYDRFDYAKKTIQSFFANSDLKDLAVYFHISDDGSPAGYRSDLVSLAKRAMSDNGVVGAVSSTDSNRRGYGASYNLGTQQVHQLCRYVIPLEDDWELVKPFYAMDWIGCLAKSDLGCIRFGYLGFTQDLSGTLVKSNNHVLLELDPDSPERHVCAGHPRLEKVTWSRKIGQWTEGLNPGATEHDWCGRPEARVSVAWPIEYGLWGPWSHIGTHQARDDQHE